jgi:hypothetical protein
MGFKIKIFCGANFKLAVLPIMLLVSFFIFPRVSSSEFYRYVDNKGTVHFVDSKSQIPSEYRNDLTVYKEKYDNLSEEEREKRIEEDRRQAELFQKEREAHLSELRRKERINKERLLLEQKREALAEKRRAEQIVREEYLKSLQTKIEIVGYGQALVPCRLLYKDREVEAKLLLDTGCSITTIHEDVAKQLNFKTRMKGKAQTAGGDIVGVRYGKLSCIKVGPYKINDLYVGVIKHKGPKSRMNGLLGMNFLAGLDYTIDYSQNLIRWAPMIKN